MTTGFWEQRYGGQDYFYGTKPNDFLRQHYHHFPAAGELLCLAEGEGRNAVFLARQGFKVTGVDACAMGLAKAQALARHYRVNIVTQTIDLRDFDLGKNRWDAIISIWCHLPTDLRRQVHLQCQQALKPGGIFLLEAYRPEQISLATGGPKDLDMLPTLAQLNQELSTLTPLLAQAIEREVREGTGHTGHSAVVQWLGSKT